MPDSNHFVAVLAALLAAAPVESAIWVPTTFADGADLVVGNGICDADPGLAVVCTLRAAIQEANVTVAADEILLAPGTYVLSIAGIDEDAAAGDLDATSGIAITGVGVGQTRIDQTAADRVFEVGLLASSLELTDLTVSGGDVVGNASDFGGGIRNLGTLALERVRVTDNRAQIGGGVINFEVMTGNEVAIDGNTATSRGAALASASFSSSGPPPNTLVLTNSTIGPNTSAIAPTEMELANAYGVMLTNVTVSPESTALESVTIGNQDAELVHVTLLGGLRLFSFDESNQVSITNSAIEFCSMPSTMAPMLVRNGVNASTDSTCGFAAAGGIEGPFGLGPLAENGGPTPTHEPLEGSALVDAADEAFCVGEDQRGVARAQGPGCDIGAVEVPEPGAVAVGGAALLAIAARRRRMR